MKKKTANLVPLIATGIVPTATLTSALVSSPALGATGDLDTSFGAVGRLGLRERPRGRERREENEKNKGQSPHAGTLRPIVSLSPLPQARQGRGSMRWRTLD